MSHFYTPWKRQKIFGFLTFSGSIVMWHGLKWVKFELKEVKHLNKELLVFWYLSLLLVVSTNISYKLFSDLSYCVWTVSEDQVLQH